MKMCRVRAATVAIAVILFAGLSLDALAFTLSNFQNPQCVRVDPDDNVYYVTNLAGGAEDKNREGYVSKISPNGSLVFQKWIGGKTSDGNAVLDSPKGLAIYQGLLYIADAREIKIFSKKTMKLVRSVDLAPLGARSLSNLAVDSDGGFLYVSDPFGNQIFRIDIARNCLASVYKRTSELGSPKGIIVNPRNHSLMVVGSQSGSLLELDRSLRIHVVRRGLSGLEGLDFDNQGNIYISSISQGEIYKIGFYGRGLMSVCLSGLTAPTDFCYDRKKDQLVIPSLKRNTVTTVFHDQLSR